MPTLHYIDYKVERKTKVHAFALLMFSKNSLTSNILVFENLNIVQMNIKRIDARWNNCLTIW